MIINKNVIHVKMINYFYKKEIVLKNAQKKDIIKKIINVRNAILLVKSVVMNIIALNAIIKMNIQIVLIIYVKNIVIIVKLALRELIMVIKIVKNVTKIQNLNI